MGITYKAFDVDLRCPVTLKVISERYLGDESARRRFLREARAAASVRHPNVASVFHLGRSGGNYFCAMEFVEGETLENLTRAEGKPEQAVPKIVEGRVNAWIADQTLIEQKMIPEEKEPVEKALGDATVERFVQAIIGG